jgi:DNA-binding transcriptional LysR family regulator
LYPDIQLELNSNDLIIDLLEQSTDIAIRIGTLADSTACPLARLQSAADRRQSGVSGAARRADRR